MDDTFDLPVFYKDEELFFPAALHQFGYTHRFEVLVNGVAVQFERDEEGAYRALVDSDENNKHFDLALLKAIAESIETILK